MPHDLNVNYISEFPRKIESNEFGVFFTKMKESTCPAGTIIFMPEESGERLYMLRRGRVELFRITPGGKRLVIRQILPGEIFGIMGALGQTEQGNYAETTEDSLIASAGRDEFLEILKQRPELALRLLEVVGARLRLLEERLVDAVYSTVRQRIVHFLLNNVNSNSYILMDFSHAEIGDYIGAARQTVTDNLNKMQDQGFISIRPKKIKIVDMQGLKQIIN
jgi:CRP/FNR family transcriptional regulator, cyclic AMP receptor protein